MKRGFQSKEDHINEVYLTDGGGFFFYFSTLLNTKHHA